MSAPVVSAPDSVLATLPAGAPPEGVVPNFSNSTPTLGTPFIIVGAVLLPIALVFTGIRMYTKFRIVHHAWWDDLTCGLAAFLTLAYYVNMCLGVTKGRFGRHQYDISILQVISPWFNVPIYIENWLSTVTLALAKCTFLLLYIQIFRPLRWLRLATYGGLIFTTVVFFAFTIVQFYYLSPKIGESWLEMLQDPREAKAVDVSVPLSAIGVAVDIYVLLLPISGVAHLQLSARRKFGIILVFLTGLGACISSSLSLYYKTVLNKNKGDTSWYSMPVIITALVEMCVGITCSCMPSLVKFVRHFFPDFDIIDSILSNRFFSLLTRLNPSSTSSKSKTKAKYPGAPSNFPNKRGKKQVFDSSLKSFHQIGESADELRTPAGSEEIQDIELGNVKTTRTYIDATGYRDVEDHGIHVQSDVEQSWKIKR